MSRTAITPAYTLGPQAEPGFIGPEDASETWVAGAPLTKNSGRLAECSADPRSIIGFAAEDASGTQDTNVRLYPCLQTQVFEGTLDKASGLGTRALLQSDVFSEFGLTRDASGVWYVDVDKTTGGNNTVAYIVGLKDPVGAIQGDTPTATNSGNCRVYFVVLGEVNAFHSA